MPNINIFVIRTGLIPAVPHIWFGSADCDTICTNYLSLSTQTADPNIFKAHSVP